ncbi:MAG: glycosyltransferase family 9 protein [Pseudomonadota bacterium]
MNPVRWDQARKVLCVRLDGLGDVLMCTPAIRAIKQARAGRSVTLLGSAAGAAAAPFIGELDGAITYRAPWMKSGAAQAAGADLAFVRTLQAGGFDAAVIFTSFSQSALPAALLCHLAGIPNRLAHCRENPYHLLSDWVAEREPAAGVRHEVRRQLDLVASIGCRPDSARLSFTVRAHDLDHVRCRLAMAGIGAGQPWLLLHPGASAPSRRYPPAQWAELAAALAAKPGLPLVLTGGPDERDLVDQIRAACGVRVCSLAGQLNLGQLGAAIALARLVVANNTGPAHIAAALGTPIVTLYALTNPQHAPWQVEHQLLFHDLPCRFCYKSVCPQGHNDCLTKIAPARVADAVRGLLASPRKA